MRYGRVHGFSRTVDETAFGETGNRVLVAAFQHGACLNHHYRGDEYGAAGQRLHFCVRAPGHLGRQPVSLVDQVVWMHFESLFLRSSILRAFMTVQICFVTWAENRNIVAPQELRPHFSHAETRKRQSAGSASLTRAAAQRKVRRARISAGFQPDLRGFP